MRIFNEKTVVNYANPPIPDKSGYLMKKRSENKESYKRRYFVLNGNVLMYNEHKNDKDHIGVIFLEGHCVELVDDCVFTIRFNSSETVERNYILKAETDSEAEAWMQALTHCGSEFLMLSVEELEDHLRLLTSMDSQLTAASSSPSKHRHGRQNSSVRNPFNHTPVAANILPESTRRNHLAQLYALSWEELQGGFRKYLDKTIASP